MQGLMQQVPLTLYTVLERAGTLYPSKTVTTKTGSGFHRETYGELVERVGRLASALKALGIKPGDRVATAAWNSYRHLELYLAVPCMGAVLHTLNIRLDPDQLSYIANHAEDQIVFVDASISAAWRKVTGLKTVREVVWMDDVEGAGAPHDGLDYEELVVSGSSDFAWPRLDENAAAAMCYTSGTTGNPRGVVYSHRSSVLHSLATLFADGLALSEPDVCLPIVPQFHVNAWGTPYGSLLAGASLAMTGRFMDPMSVSQLVAAVGVTVSAAVPTVWFGVLQAINAGQVDPSTLSTLKRIICGGSAVPEVLMRGYDELGIRILHGWGMTETSPIGTISTVKSTIPAEQMLRARLMQGISVPMLKVRHVNDAGEIQPWDGESMGELQISGPWIADAYYEPERADNRGGLEQFCDDEANNRWLKTGDVAVIDSEGYVKLVDRTKDLVKSGGEWISTVELENQLMAHPKVTEAVVIAVPHLKWGERPLACVVPADSSVTKEELIEHLAAHFAKWQLPDDVVFIKEVPKTSVGKFNKKLLRDHYADYQLATH
jgi:fatty-acyl-CoA synthase